MDTITMYIENSKGISGKLLDLKCGFTKLVGYKVNMKKLIIFLLITSKEIHSEFTSE